MIAILVHWLIREEHEQQFQKQWKAMTVAPDSGLYREVLTTLRKPDEGDEGNQADKFHTFSVGDPFYSTFINIGFWESLAHFDKAIGQYIPEAKVEEKDGRRVHTVQLEEYEFKLRERVVLNIIGSRGGDLPLADIE